MFINLDIVRFLMKKRVKKRQKRLIFRKRLAFFNFYYLISFSLSDQQKLVLPCG